jgi:hypothetical protein
MLVDSESQVEKYIKPENLQNGGVIYFGGDNSDTELIFEDIKVTVIIAKYCIDAAKALFAEKKPSPIDDMVSSLDRMREAHDELMDKLDELRLTPVILQTRCDICPA